MSKPTVVAVVLSGEEIVADALLDPMAFVAKHSAALDAQATRTALAGNRFAITHGSAWGLFLPGERDTASIREQYGDEPADLVDATLEQAPEQAVVAWKVMETIPRGQG